MARRELRCPCGGEVEERGSVRYYGTGKAYVAIDGVREFVTETWSTPIETLEVDDDGAFHCLDCDVQYALVDLVEAKPRVLMGCGCDVGKHDDSISAISQHHPGMNPWAIRTAIQKEALLAARAAQEAGNGPVSDSEPLAAEGGVPA